MCKNGLATSWWSKILVMVQFLQLCQHCKIIEDGDKYIFNSVAAATSRELLTAGEILIVEREMVDKIGPSGSMKYLHKW